MCEECEAKCLLLVFFFGFVDPLDPFIPPLVIDLDLFETEADADLETLAPFVADLDPFVVELEPLLATLEALVEAFIDLA